MAPLLYFVSYSQPSKAALLTIKALDLNFDLKEISLINGDQYSEEYLKLNPQHTVPTLVEDDGFVLWDSHAIMPYLVDKYGKTDALYPKDLRKRATVDQRLHFESGVLFPVTMNILRPLLYEGVKVIPEEKLTNLKQAYGFLEKFLQDSEWVAGPALTIADFSVLSSITVMDILAAIQPAEYPNIVAWLERMKMLPYYDVSQKGVDQLKQLIAEALK